MEIRSTGINLLEMTSAHQCRFPVGEDDQGHLFCGKRTLSGSWCKEHRKRVYEPANQRKRVAYYPTRVR